MYQSVYLITVSDMMGAVKEVGIHNTIVTVGKYWLKSNILSIRPKKKMCVYGHTTDPIFQPPTLTCFIGNYSTLIFASDPINFYTEFG